MRKLITLYIILFMLSQSSSHAQQIRVFEKGDRFDWIQTARIFLLDAYQPPFAPELEYDAEILAETMIKMNANLVRPGTMGKYATIQGVRFTMHPDQGNRDLLKETIDACKPKGIKVMPYISTGHKLAWSMVTEDYPEYAHQSTPGGLPNRSHMYVGEDHGTVCWMTPYREAYMDLVEHVVRDYDIDGIYFDAWMPFYFWEGKQLCYCDGCRSGFRKAKGLEIPYHQNDQDYTANDSAIINSYHNWYIEEYNKIVISVQKLVKSYKDIPLISNINNPEKMANVDPAIINSMDAFLYERGHSILERAEGVSVARSVGLHVLPYIGTYHGWPRLAFQGINYQQEIFTNLMFGGGSIIAQPTGYVYQDDNRKYVSYPFEIIEKHERELEGLENYPYVGVLYAYHSPEKHITDTWHYGETNSQNSSLGAFAACMYNHIQVSSISEFVLDNPTLLKKYPVLYLANYPYLSGERIRNIKEYVNNGGCLIGSYAATLFGNDGNKLARFDLEDLFKVRPVIPAGDLAADINSYRAMIGGPNDLYLKATDQSSDLFNGENQNRLFPLFHYEPVEVLDGGEVLMNIVTGYDQKAILPGVVMSKYGKGRVIYCSTALESFYGSEGAGMAGELIQKLIKKIAFEPEPYYMDSPASLLGNLTRKHNTLVFHMTNWTGNKFEHPLWNEYYLSPVENVNLHIRIPEGKKVKNVSILVKADYKKKIRGQNLELYFPRVEAYQAVVVELE